MERTILTNINSHISKTVLIYNNLAWPLVSSLLVTNDAAIVSLVEQLSSAYKKETDADVKERLLLMRRVKLEGMGASKVAEKELSRTRWRALQVAKEV